MAKKDGFNKQLQTFEKQHYNKKLQSKKQNTWKIDTNKQARPWAVSILNQRRATNQKAKEKLNNHRQTRRSPLQAIAKVRFGDGDKTTRHRSKLVTQKASRKWPEPYQWHRKKFCQKNQIRSKRKNTRTTLECLLITDIETNDESKAANKISQ